MIRGNNKKKAHAPIARRGTFLTTSNAAIDDTHLGEQCDEATLGPKTGAALEELESRRTRFLRCSGMHTEAVWWVVSKICKGQVNGPGLSFVAPALYEGIPEFLDSIKEGLSELAVYSSLYMGLVSTIAFTGFRPIGWATIIVMNGVYASMYMHSGVVFLVICHRIGAIGHLRDSDKILYLWRARYLPLVASSLFFVASAGVIISLMMGVASTLLDGGGCIPDQERLGWWDWYADWARSNGDPNYKVHLMQYADVGQGLIHPKGEIIQNPWMKKAAQLNISYDLSWKPHYAGGKPLTILKQYDEFMRDYFDQSRTCASAFGLDDLSENGFSVVFWIYMFPPFLSVLWLVLWVVPTRNLFNYWAGDRNMPGITDPYLRTLLSFLGFFSYYPCGPFASSKVDDPYDMTEAWEEFRFRAKVGKALALKDLDGNGFIDVDEHKRTVSSMGSSGDVQTNPMVMDGEQDVELTSIVPPLERHEELLASAGLKVETMKKLSEQTLYTILKDVGVAPGDACELIIAIADPTSGPAT